MITKYQYTKLQCDVCKKEVPFFANNIIKWNQGKNTIKVNITVHANPLSKLYLRSSAPFIKIFSNGQVVEDSKCGDICRDCVIKLIEIFLENQNPQSVG